MHGMHAARRAKAREQLLLLLLWTQHGFAAYVLSLQRDEPDVVRSQEARTRSDRTVPRAAAATGTGPCIQKLVLLKPVPHEAGPLAFSAARL